MKPNENSTESRELKELKPEYYFKDMKACPCPEAFEGIDYVWEALEKKKPYFEMKYNLNHGKLANSVKTEGKVRIGKNTTVDHFVKIEGPVIIGENCTIKKGAYIRPGAIVGNNCSVGHNSEVKNSIMFDNATISEKSYVGDSILGKGAWVATGVTTGNLKLNKRDVAVFVDGKVIDTKIKKLGCIIGDGAKIGNNIVLVPGTLIGPNAIIYSRMPSFFEAGKAFEVEQEVKEKK
jgi:bifunctional UDP-N-acetylglucosamine pyrophosphorylase/glucosamine-1-phosphate N-acetyltransferase